jgi:hypothetical protein
MITVCSDLGHRQIMKNRTKFAIEIPQNQTLRKQGTESHGSSSGKTGASGSLKIAELPRAVRQAAEGKSALAFGGCPSDSTNSDLAGTADGRESMRNATADNLARVRVLELIDKGEADDQNGVSAAMSPMRRSSCQLRLGKCLPLYFHFYWLFITR